MVVIRVEEPEREYSPSPPSVCVRICRHCGKHYVGMMPKKANDEALSLTQQALAELRKESSAQTERRFWELQKEVMTVLDSSNGVCRSCSLFSRKQGVGHDR